MSDWNQMIDIYYQTMGGDVETGKQLSETLNRLDLGDTIKDIWQ